jgi:dihydroorotase
MKLLIKRGTIVNHNEIRQEDILIQNSKIAKIGKGIKDKADREIDAKGKFIFPAFIDMHTHLRTPGREDEEDLHSGSQAAAKGGFAKVFCMPNTQPPIDNEGLVKWIISQAESIGIVDIYPVGAVTKGREGKELTEFGALKRAGSLALSDDGSSIKDTLLLRRALEYAKMFDLLIISHCEDSQLSNSGSLRESFIASTYGISSIPDICESLIVERNIQMAKYLDAKIHLAHISSASSLKVIKRAKEEGIKVSCETCPHYFILTVGDIEKRGFDSNLKVNPPLGEDKDIKSIKEALKEGVIDCIATDHAPHSKAEKELPFESAPFGFIGLECAFSLSYTYLVKEKTLSLQEMVEKLSFNPARITGLQGVGKIQEGFFADLAIADLDKKWKVTESNLVSKSKNTPFLGYELEGVVEYTIHKGKIVYERSGEK